MHSFMTSKAIICLSSSHSPIEKSYDGYTVHPCISSSIFFASSIWGRKWRVFLRITCQMWYQIFDTASRICVILSHKQLASLCDSHLSWHPSGGCFSYQCAYGFWSSIWGRKCEVLRRITCQKLSQVHHTTSRRSLYRARKSSRMGYRSP